ncbi:MAG: hypothetical protein WC797_02035 [Candidatus Paceibacterota bacterium]|jgi:hypothetical protein
MKFLVKLARIWKAWRNRNTPKKSLIPQCAFPCTTLEAAKISPRIEKEIEDTRHIFCPPGSICGHGQDSVMGNITNYLVNEKFKMEHDWLPCNCISEAMADIFFFSVSLTALLTALTVAPICLLKLVGVATVSGIITYKSVLSTFVCFTGILTWKRFVTPRIAPRKFVAREAKRLNENPDNLRKIQKDRLGDLEFWANRILSLLKGDITSLEQIKSDLKNALLDDNLDPDDRFLIEDCLADIEKCQKEASSARQILEGRVSEIIQDHKTEDACGNLGQAFITNDVERLKLIAEKSPDEDIRATAADLAHQISKN